MQNFLATCLTLGILCGGFALTGDLGRLAARGLRLIQATDLPDDDAPVPVSAPVEPADAAAAPPVVGARRPTVPTSPARIDVVAVAPGSRVLVWLDGATAPLAMDVIDPASAAVILHHGTPQRVAIAGGSLVRGQPLRVTSLGLAHAGVTVAPESLGLIADLTLGQ